MSIRTGLICVPRWLQTAVGVALTTGIALVAVGAVALPQFFRALRPQTANGAATVTAAVTRQAEAAWQASADAIAHAKVAAHLIPDTPVARREALIGAEVTPLVTTLGSIEAKRLTLSPRWAGVIAEQFVVKGIGRDDVVAASFSGSFPALNLAVVSACQAIGARLIAVSSVTASTWGANQPGFTWPEMEVLLVEGGTMVPVSVAVSAGGSGDRARDLDADAQRLARTIARRTADRLGAALVEPLDLRDAIEARLALFDRRRNGRPIAAYVNVGGTEASLGSSTAILKIASGWVPAGAFDPSPDRGLVARMAERGIPVLHLLNVRDLAARWGLL
jgi:poly-gamma-glutamate system protein